MNTSKVDEMLRDRLRALPRASINALTKIGLEVQTVAKREAKVDRGELRANIAIDRFAGPSGPTVVVEAKAKHSIYLEKGTRPHTPPFAPIERWAFRHGLEPGRVWSSIRVKGTKPHPFMEPAREHGQRVFKSIAERELARWAV